MIDPREIREVLKKSGHLHKTNRLLAKNNYGASVMHMLDLMKQHNTLPDIERDTKCKYKSQYLRDRGNEYYKTGEFGLALQHYNLALLFAPKHSTAMQLAYGNRSALFMKVERYNACKKDIETVLKMGFPPELKPKLLARLHKCRDAEHKESQKSDEVKEFCKKLLQVKISPSESIPCASSVIQIERKENNKTVVATELLEPGDIIAVETPFASHISQENQNFCCHKCHEFFENLIPCDTCCSALYCGETCRRVAWEEGHRIECDMISLVSVLPNLFRLSLKAVLKARSQYPTWEKLMEIVKHAKLLQDTIPDKLEAKYEFLCTQAPFKNMINPGHMFDMTVFSAITVHGLSQFAMADVEHEKKNEVMTFIGNQLVFHTVEGISKHMSAALSCCYERELTDVNLTLPNKGIGYFPFAGLLPHSCNPNVECFGLNNKLVLVATKPIPPGTKLVTCYGLTYLEGDLDQRKAVLQKHFRMTCYCEVCKKNWKTESFPTYDISSCQDDFIIMFILGGIYKIKSLEDAIKKFPNVCSGLTHLYDKPKSQYMSAVYKAFRTCISFFQYHFAPHYLRGDILTIQNTLKMLTFTKK